MRHTALRTGIALLVLSGLASTAGGQAVDGTLAVERAKARFAQSRRTGAARHMLKLTLLVGPRHLPDLHVAEQHSLRVTLDGTDLCGTAPGADGYRARKRGRWRYKGEIAGGRVRLTANGRSGRVRVKVTRADLSGLEASPAADLLLSLELAGTVLETTASFRIYDGRVRHWTGLAHDFPPDPDPLPDPGPGDPLPSKETLLADLQRRGADFFQSGTSSPGGGFDGKALRCPSGNPAEVVALAVPPPGTADFFTDTAYVCRGVGQYWVHRTGGFAGVSLWLGPFPAP